MQKNGFYVCLIISLLESRSKWLLLYSFYLVFLILYNPVEDSVFHSWTSSVNKKNIFVVCIFVSKSKARRSGPPSLLHYRENSSGTISPNCLFWHLTLIDRGSALWLNTRPLPHNALTGHEKHHCTSKQPTHSLPHHPTWHVRQHWPQQWLNLFDGKMLECVFTSGRLLACPSVVRGTPGSLKSSGCTGDAASRPESAKSIGSTCCRHMGRIRHRVFDQGEFLTLMAEEDGHAAVLWFFDLSDAKCGAEIFDFKVFRIRTILCLS